MCKVITWLLHLMNQISLFWQFNHLSEQDLWILLSVSLINTNAYVPTNHHRIMQCTHCWLSLGSFRKVRFCSAASDAFELNLLRFCLLIVCCNAKSRFSCLTSIQIDATACVLDEAENCLSPRKHILMIQSGQLKHPFRLNTCFSYTWLKNDRKSRLARPYIFIPESNSSAKKFRTYYHGYQYYMDAIITNIKKIK